MFNKKYHEKFKFLSKKIEDLNVPDDFYDKPSMKHGLCTYRLINNKKIEFILMKEMKNNGDFVLKNKTKYNTTFRDLYFTDLNEKNQLRILDLIEKLIIKNS